MYNLKKTVAVSLVAASLAATCAVAASAAGFEKGDFNMDGVVDSNDALLTLQASCSPIIELSDEQIDVGDFNDDGYVDSGDALLILRKSIEVDGQVMIDTKLLTTVDVTPPKEKTFTQVSEMQGWSAAEVVEKVGFNAFQTGLSCAKIVCFNAEGQVFGLNQTVVAASKLVLQHLGILGADSIKFIAAGRDGDAPGKGFLRCRQVDKGKLELHRAVKVI